MPKKSRIEKILPAIGNLTAEECSKLKHALKARKSQVEGSVVLQKRAENIKSWMFRFRGVATKNLPNCLGWHRYLDVPATKPTPRKFLTGALGD